MSPPANPRRLGSGYGGLRIPPDQTGTPARELRGERQTHPGYEPSLPPDAELPVVADPPSPSLFVRAAQLPLARVLALIVASGTAISGIIATTFAGVVNMMVARRPPDAEALSKRIDALEQGQKGGDGLKLETETRQKKDEELAKAVESASTRAAAAVGLEQRVKKLEGKR